MTALYRKAISDGPRHSTVTKIPTRNPSWQSFAEEVNLFDFQPPRAIINSQTYLSPWLTASAFPLFRTLPLEDRQFAQGFALMRNERRRELLFWSGFSTWSLIFDENFAHWSIVLELEKSKPGAKISENPRALTRAPIFAPFLIFHSKFVAEMDLLPDAPLKLKFSPAVGIVSSSPFHCG